jgi:hypothetical protein
VDVLAADGPLGPLYARRGPFTSAYVDLTPGGSLDERWGVVRSRLTERGSRAVDLDAIEEAVVAAAGEDASYGVVAIAAEGGLALSERLARPPRDSGGTVAPLPRVMPWLLDRIDVVPNVVVVAGARPWLARLTSGGLVPGTAPEDGSPAGVARAASRAIGFARADLLLVGGEPRAREQLVVALGAVIDPGVRVRLLPVPGAERAVVEAGTREVMRAIVTALGDPALDELRRPGRNGRVVTGSEAVVRALRMARVDTLVLGVDAGLGRPCWVGDRPTEFGLRENEASALGVRAPGLDRLDSALVRAAYATRASLVLAGPGQVALPQGVGALLRRDRLAG